MKKRILYLLEKGFYMNSAGSDIKNYRVNVLENVDIEYKGTLFNMFFSFSCYERYSYRTTNKRTGAPLKKMVKKLLLENGLWIDSEYSIIQKTLNGNTFEASFRNRELENEFFQECLSYSKANILKVVNRYKVGAKYEKVVLVKEEALKIIEEIGGYREKFIAGDGVSTAERFMTIEEWTEDHKIVCFHYIEKDAERVTTEKTCDIDLETRRITG